MIFTPFFVRNTAMRPKLQRRYLAHVGRVEEARRRIAARWHERVNRKS
jgi:hypothetical protein